MKFNIIGAGRLGKNIASALLSQGNHELIAICNQTPRSTTHALEELGCGIAVESLSQLPPADITFITTPDDAIASIASTLRVSNSIVVHCSGVLSSDVLSPLKHQNNAIASIHPLKAFRKDDLQRNALNDCYCVIEGDALAIEQINVIFTALGARVVSIQSDQKPTYHAAAVMASNYMVTLASCAMDLFTQAGLTSAQAKDITQTLMQSSLSNIQQTAMLTEALTGPLARGDINTIQKHLSAIEPAHIHALYRAAAMATLPLTSLPLNHPIKKVLDEG